jgi:hypothetical protein
LVDVVILGSTLELCWVYNDNPPPAEGLQRKMNQEAFIDFKNLFCSRQRLLVDGEMVCPKDFLFDVYLLQLAVSIARYSHFSGESEKIIVGNIRQHLRIHHCNLATQFETDFATPEEKPYFRTFNWTGPVFEVVPHRGESNRKLSLHF